MKKSNKKGFTIVELVIVIAVIAILAAVLIPTFSNLIKKANESSDVQAVRQMNTFLAADGAVTPTTPGRLLDVLKEGGFDAENYKPLVANRAFFWDRSLNQILYVDTTNGEVLFPKKVEANQATWYSLNGSTTLFGQEVTVTPPEAPEKIQEFTVSNGADFIKVAEFVRNNKEFYKSLKPNTPNQDPTEGTITIVLSGDINLQGADINFTQDNTQGLNVVFKSNEAGVKRTISGLYISDQHTTTGNSSDGTVGNDYGHSLFNHIKDLTVQDVAIEYSVIGGFEASQAGFFAGQVSGNASFTNVSVTNSDIQGNRKVGVLCGFTHGTVSFTNVKIDNCTVSSAFGETGAVIGLMSATNVADGADVVINKDITVTNTSVSIAAVEGYTQKTVKDANGNEYAVVEKGGKIRVATANFAFFSQNANLTNKKEDVQISDKTLSAYTALDTKEAFVNAKSEK
ncbi:MAG: type II secretion system protein [Clostridia bacterium]|nr:type II secretion system protein [Clostridia bacterium]